MTPGNVSFNGALPAAGTLKIVYDGDDAGNGSAGLRSPDNIAFSKDGFIYAQEDKAVYSAASEPKYGTEKGSIWKLDPTTGKAVRWVQIDDSIDPDGAGGQALDKTDSSYLAYGWESSGIIDVSALYNHAPGTDFFANVQTHGVKGGAITDFNLAAGGQILKLETTVKRKELDYVPSTGGDPIKVSFRPTSGALEGDVEFRRLASAPVMANQAKNLQIGQTGIDFALKLADGNTTGEASTVVDLKPLLDGLNPSNKRLAYFVYDTRANGQSPTAMSFTYDPIKKVGAKFYDLDADGTAETADLKFIDGGYGDKDGSKNGVVVDPSAAGVADLKLVLSTQTGSPALTIADPLDPSSPASVLLKVAVTAKAPSVNQIGYVALAGTEPDTFTFEQLRDRGTVILANLENSDTPNLSAINLERTISVINGQKLVLFEVVDTTLYALLSKSTSLQNLGSNFRTLDLSKTNDTLVIAGKGANSVAVSLLDATKQLGLTDLITNSMGKSPIFDFRGVSARDLTGTVSIAREALFDTEIGFYKIQGANGAVLDTITNTFINPGAAGYKEAALSSDNLFTGFGKLAVANGATRTDAITNFRDIGMLAPFARVNQTGDTWFTFIEENVDGLEHFRTLGSGSIGLEDIKAGLEQDFDDIIVSFGFKLQPASPTVILA